MLISATPYGPDGMNDRFGRKIPGKRNYRVSWRALPLLLTYHLTGFKQRRPRRPVDGTIPPSPAHQ